MKTTQRRLLRPAALLGAGLLTASLVLTACGGDDEAGGDTDAYCDALASAKSDVEGLGSEDPAAFEKALDAFDELAAKTPAAVADDWAVVEDTMQTIRDGLADAGLEFDDIGALTSGQLPEGADPQKVAQLGETFQQLDTQEFDDATEAIRAHAEDECGITLSGS